MTNTMPKNYVELILDDEKLTQAEKIQRINYVYNNYQEKLDEDLRNYLIKIWSGGLLEIVSAAIPFGGAGKLGATAGQKLLQKSIGRKLSQEIGAGAASGLASGGVFGTGRGLIEDKNPLLTGLQDLTSGLLLGGSMGAIGGNLNRIFAGNTLKQYQLNNITPADYKKYKQQAQNFYKDYLQGRTIVNKDIGSIDITRKGLDEIFSKNVELAQLFPDLINDLRKADYVETNALYKVRKDKATEKFHILKNGENKHFIAEDKLGNKKFYLTKKYTTDQGTPSRVEGTSSGGAFIHNGTPQAASPGSKDDILKDTHKSGSHATSTDTLVSPYNIINDISKNINPVQAEELKNLQKSNKSAAKRLTVSAPASNLSLEKGDNSISRLAADKSIINDNSKKINPAPMIIPPQILQNPQEDNQPSFLLEGGVEMNVDQNGNQIFTPQQIGDMTSDEFEKNLKIIEQQLKDGLIKPETQKLNYSGYSNPISGEDKIFTRELISQMTGDEYSGNESAIMAQLNSIGIPYESDLELASMNGGGLIYVKPYTRSDGTEVRGYWRSA